MTAEPDLLPLPEADGFMESFDIYGCPVGTEDAWAEETVKDYARANVAHATAAKDAEIEALRVEVATREGLHGWNFITGPVLIPPPFASGSSPTPPDPTPQEVPDA